MKSPAFGSSFSTSRRRSGEPSRFPRPPACVGLHDAIQAVVPFKQSSISSCSRSATAATASPIESGGADMRDAKNIRIGALIGPRSDRASPTPTTSGTIGGFTSRSRRFCLSSKKRVYPRLVGGARRGPPEDVGRVSRFQRVPLRHGGSDPRAPCRAVWLVRAALSTRPRSITRRSAFA